VKQIPPPALLGIVGPYAIVRAPGGQTDLVAEGKEIGGVKVLKIGTNRVLLEFQGKTQEFLLFQGLGGTPLLMPEATAPAPQKQVPGEGQHR